MEDQFMNESIVAIPLRSPVEHNGQTFDTLKMREPKVRDSLTARKQGGTDAAVEVLLFANLCDVHPDVVENMGMHDYGKLQDAYKGFLS